MNINDEFNFTYRIVFNYTVPIKENDGPANGNMGAGVLIDVGGKLLVATARHCIEDDPIVLDNDCHLGGQRRVKVLNRCRHPTLDIGFLELERDRSISIFNRGECSLRSICLEPLLPNGVVHIVGFPAVARRLHNSGLTAVRKGFGTQFLSIDEGGRYIFRFPEMGWTWNKAIKDYVQAPFDETPHGYSGGGCWGFVQPNSGLLFNPENHLRLYAIQTACDRVARHVKCVPFAFWLRLVSDAYPELRPAIASAVPDSVA